jgi:hypothetical protein
MAFDDFSRDSGSGSNARYAGSPGGGSDVFTSGLSRSINALSQAIDTIDKLVGALGSAADSPTLRGRLAAAETKADSLRSELDNGVRKLRVEGMAGGAAGAGAAERVIQQYAELRRRLLESLRNSQAKQRQFRAPNPGDYSGVESVTNPAGPAGSRAGAGKAYPQRGFGEAIELSALKSLDDVDEAILEVS